MISVVYQNPHWDQIGRHGRSIADGRQRRQPKGCHRRGAVVASRSPVIRGRDRFLIWSPPPGLNRRPADYESLETHYALSGLNLPILDDRLHFDADSHHGAPDVVITGLQLPATAYVCAGLGSAALLKRGDSGAGRTHNQPGRIEGRSLFKNLSRNRSSDRRTPVRRCKHRTTAQPGPANRQNAAETHHPDHQRLSSRPV